MNTVVLANVNDAKVQHSSERPKDRAQWGRERVLNEKSVLLKTNGGGRGVDKKEGNDLYLGRG